ncbi:MAG TPA: TatD family hydrolase [Lacipirellulaceae bacterium]|nr:TatD family hydrolase [Lacipirellulaceae bacterium]HMP05039.1 TatD family hydrolase [Lacipirellulaceae bacterium]
MDATLVDTHAHLDHEDFELDREAIVARARDVGVCRIVAVGTTLSSSRECVRLARQFDCVHAAVGIHPNNAAEAAPADFGSITELAGDSHVVAIGETGLDRHWEFTPFDLQREYFTRHIRLAVEHDLPFIVHMRDCESDVLAALREAHAEYGDLRGVMHSFTGDAELAEQFLALGLHISFAGMVTFKRSDELRRCAATIPAQRLLVETDAPYLSPEPLRKIRRNEPAFVRHTAGCLAEVRGVSFAELARQTTANALQLFRRGR